MKTRATAAALLLLATPCASAQATDEQWFHCENDGSSDDRLAEAIVACSAILAAGAEAPLAMAYAFYHRGLAYSGQRDYARAIADFGEAIRLNSTSVASFYQRGRAYRAQGEEARAAADTATAAGLDPALLAVYQRRDAATAQ